MPLPDGRPTWDEAPEYLRTARLQIAVEKMASQYGLACLELAHAGHRTGDDFAAVYEAAQRKCSRRIRAHSRLLSALIEQVRKATR
ncbi:hypothetical protein C5N14_30825 [Micromonospora sp. MW-13]|uniref:hypothetical protein n=1 Tax=Micromonospora sp. MW-13 TaxID=2094022 RepID=UPI000E445E40|nr:hypothetical protein [Micromonospora sp. MW-13]RGC64987.1 hypothetical protein C5N14_30825 [Micromonospora sp. MW-13]